MFAMNKMILLTIVASLLIAGACAEEQAETEAKSQGIVSSVYHKIKDAGSSIMSCIPLIGGAPAVDDADEGPKRNETAGAPKNETSEAAAETTPVTLSETTSENAEEAQTEAAAEAKTEAASEAETEAATEAETEAATEAETEAAKKDE